MYEIFERIITEKGLKPADVARGTGLSSTFFTEWKKGKSKNPNPVNLKKIADYLEVSLDYLMTGDESKKSSAQTEELPEDIRVAARGMMELSPDDLKLAIDMINSLAEKGREAKKN